jgi:hypothetical protein
MQRSFLKGGILMSTCVCPKCGGSYTLREEASYEVNDDGFYNCAKPVNSDATLTCDDCGYSPGFDLLFEGQVSLHPPEEN